MSPASLRMGCVPDLPLQRLQAFLGLLHQREHDLEVDVVHLHATAQVEALRRDGLSLGLLHDGQEADLEAESVFAGEPLAAYLAIGHRLDFATALAPEDLAREVLLAAPRALDPGRHTKLIDTLEAAGYHFRAVRETPGPDARDLLFAATQGRGVAIAAVSLSEVVGEAPKIVTRHKLAPAVPMPDTLVAWRPGEHSPVDRLIAVARDVARELRAASDAW